MTDVITYMIIRPDRTWSIETGPLGLEVIQGIVGGYIEPVGLNDGHHCGFINEEGKFGGYERNDIATALCSHRIGGADHIVGTMVVVGVVPEGGESHTSIDAEKITTDLSVLLSRGI